MVRKTVEKRIENLAGGNGTTILNEIVTAEELRGHGSLYCKVILPPKASIGYHQHKGNSEPYYILSGKGLFVDNDGSETIVGPDDVCYIEVGQSHSIENISDSEDLVFMALIYNE